MLRTVSPLFHLPSAVRRDPAVDAWFVVPDAPLRRLAEPWFERMRACGADVTELIHDGRPTACVDDAAFAYTDAFTAHINVGFFNGANLEDPAGLLRGDGKRMRHVRLPFGGPVDADALGALIAAAYVDVRMRLDAGP